MVWYAKSQEETAKELQVELSKGLNTEEVNARLERYGENQLTSQEKKSLFALFFAQMKDMLIYVLLGAAIVTLLIGEYIDSMIILLVVLINAAIGVVQENRAEKALEALQQMTTPKTLVRRNNEVVEIDSKQLVPGDIVVLDAGRY